MNGGWLFFNSLMLTFNTNLVKIIHPCVREIYILGYNLVVSNRDLGGGNDLFSTILKYIQ